MHLISLCEILKQKIETSSQAARFSFSILFDLYLYITHILTDLFLFKFYSDIGHMST